MTVCGKITRVLLGSALSVILLLTLAIGYLLVLRLEVPYGVLHPNESYSSLDQKLLPLLTHEYVETEPGIKLHVWKGGNELGKVAIFVHGFPEFAYSTWRSQMLHFIEKGYQVITPDLRGYNTSSKPQEMEAYALSRLTDDLAALARHYTKNTGSKAYVVGHDWGGVIMWPCLAKYPELFEKAVIMNAPHLSAFFRAPKRQILNSWYMLFFQLPHWLLRERFERNGFAMLVGWPKTMNRPEILSRHDIKEMQRALAQPGCVEGMVNYYRALLWYNNDREWEKTVIKVPLMLLWGRHDHALLPELGPLSLEYCSQCHLVTIDDATHWVPFEKPQKVTEEIESFFSK